HEPVDARGTGRDLRAAGAAFGRAGAGRKHARAGAADQPDTTLTMTEERRLTLTPIGIVRSPFTEKMQAPRQPNTTQANAGTGELFSGHDFEHALQDLTTFRSISLRFRFDQRERWRPQGVPPR